MQRPLVLPPDVVGHYLVGYRCRQCGGLTDAHVGYPAIKLTETTADVLYPLCIQLMQLK